MKRTLLQLLALVVALVCAAPASAQRVQAVHPVNAAPQDQRIPTERAYFTTTTASEEDVEAFRHRLIDAGARNVNWFVPDVLVCDLPVDKDAASLMAAPGIVAHGASEVATTASGPLEQVRRIYQRAAELDNAAAVGEPVGLPDSFRDAVFEASPERMQRIRKQLADVPSLSAAGPGEVEKLINQNSEILTGSIKVYMILPESNNAIDDKTETWKDINGNPNQDYLDARTNAFAVLLDWQGRFPNMGISFTLIDMMVECNYEPIHHNSKDDYLWVLDVLRRLEPDAAGITDPLAAGHVFNEKRKGGYDWIFTTFIGHSRNEPDHRFRGADYTAYAWLGGPYQITPYPAGTDPNDIGENLVFSKIYQHESSHVFWTLDEYPNSPGTCASTSGYLNYSNQNISMVGPGGIERCTPEVECIMNVAPRVGTGRPYCKWSLGHLGVIDNNNNSIPDVFEAAPVVTFATPDHDTVETDEYSVDLTVTSPAVPSQNHAFPPDVRVDYAAPLREAQFSVGGGWVALPALDGKWDEITEHSTVQIQSLPPGLTQIKFRARNEVGMWSGTYTLLVYFIGVNYSGLSAKPADGRIEVRWEVVGEAFGAQFDLYRVGPGVVIPDLRFLDPSEPLPGERLAEHVAPVGTINGFTTYRFVDRNVTPGVHYRYFVNGTGEVDTGGEIRTFRTPSHVVGETAMVPVAAGAIISHASPNPFRGEVKFSLAIPPTFATVSTGSGSYEQRTATSVEVTVYDVMGRRVKKIISSRELRDVMTLSWDGRDDRGVSVPSGVYFIRANAGPEVGVDKILLVR